jgi:hypothetical protein
MKMLPRLLATGLLVSSLVACEKNQDLQSQQEPIGDEVLTKIYNLGFGTKDVMKVDEGYIVEGDILITPEMLNSNPDRKMLRVANAEQYHTTNLVTGLPRVITISVSSSLPSSYVTATDEAIRRYNAENLQITFQRVSSGANIAITAAPRSAQYLASAGFPTASGEPHNSILVATRQIGNQPLNTVASILAHEIGHCIGFRHTDYMSRQYSCGGSPVNEGASTVGAVHIPGTPTGPDPNSWMLACIGSGQDRPFNANDKVALSYLY